MQTHTQVHTLRPAANTDVCVDMHAHNVWWRGRLWLISRHLYTHAVCTHTHTHRYDPRLWQRLAKNVLCGLSSLGTQENVGRSSRMSAVGEEPHSESWLFTVGTFHRSLHQTKTFTESPGSFVSLWHLGKKGRWFENTTVTAATAGFWNHILALCIYGCQHKCNNSFIRGLRRRTSRSN